MSDGIYYHYTTVAGGHAIIRSRRVWLSGQVIVPYVEANFWEDDEALSYMAVVIPEIWLGPKSIVDPKFETVV